MPFFRKIFSVLKVLHIYGFVLGEVRKIFLIYKWSVVLSNILPEYVRIHCHSENRKITSRYSKAALSGSFPRT